MKKRILYVLVTLIMGSLFYSCGNSPDDGPVAIPPRDRGEESVAAQMIIETYLQTHFYNYEDFQNPPADFDFKIVFDTIAGANANKIPLIDQVSSKTVQDRIEDNVTYTLYYLDVLEGEGETLNFPDIATIKYEGISVDERTITDEDDLDGDGDTTEEITIYPADIFDSSVVPIQFDLTQIVNGLQDALVEFKGATNVVSNPDGSLSFEEFGVGAVFIPSGLGYFQEPPPGSGIPLYAQLIFSFQVLEGEIGDQDNDGLLSIFEDLDGNMIEEDDDTDEDFVFNMFDNDDDNDGRPTADEIETREVVVDAGDPAPSLETGEVIMFEEVNFATGQRTFYIAKLPDEDGDGVKDYLDSDS